MEITEKIKKFHEFIDKHYIAILSEKIRKGERFMTINFSKLAEFEPELAEELLERPEETVEAAEESIHQFDLPGDSKNFKMRFNELPESQSILIRNIRSKNLNKMYHMEGVVRQKSDVRPQVTSARFECPSCGNIISTLQTDKKFKEPTRCGCGRKGKFRLLSKELIDAQGIVLEESPDDLDGGEQPKRMNVFLKDDLVSPLSEKHTNPGSKISVTGFVKEIPLTGRDGSTLTRFDLLIEANNVEGVQEDYYDVEISQEEEEKIKELAKDPKIYERVTRSIAPSIYGYDRVKEALALQLVGGCRKTRSDGMITRGDMHILLIGDPGAGKCVSGDTRVMLDSGEIVDIKSLVDQNIIFKKGKEGYPCDGSLGTVSIDKEGFNFSSGITRFWKRKAPKKMLKITTNTGSEIIVTKNHPLFTTKNGLIFAKQAEDYKISDFISLPSKLNINGELQKIPKDIIRSKAKNKVRYRVPDYLNPDFARLLGYLVGDGYVRLRKTTGVISFTNNDPDLLDDFEILIKDIFGLKVSKRKKQNSSSYEYYICSSEITRILQKIDPNIIKKSENMVINKHLCRSPNSILGEFLRSLFDCEGHVRHDRKEIEFSSKSKLLISDLKTILLRFGVISQVSSGIKYASNTVNKTKRRYYGLRISGEDLVKYYKEIGFVSSEKKERLKSSALDLNILNTNIKIIPNLAELLSTLRKKYGLKQSSFGIPRSSYQHYERGDRNPSDEQLKIICSRYNTFKTKDILISILNKIADSDIFWDKIKSVEEVKDRCDYVYDLEISKVHNFVANGIVVHNSQLLKRLSKIAPKARYVSGKGVSGAGLTASVVKDEFLNGWSLEAGALPLSNKGFCMIDELDKMSQEDTSAMHEALEGQTITISKANIQATLRAETTVLAAANPKFGRFDPYDILAKQIDLPPALINRFDLIFPIKDLPDKEKDSQMAKHILELHQNPDFGEAEIDTNLLKKYISYARRQSNPKLTDDAIEEIKEYYVKMRNQDNEEGANKAVPISARQLEALVRMTEATAKLRFADKATRKDAKHAIDLLHHCLSTIGVDPETGKIDIDRIATGISSSQRSKIFTIKEIIADLEDKLGKTIPIDDITKEASQQGIEDAQVEEVIEKLKRSGDIFEPKHGFISRI